MDLPAVNHVSLSTDDSLTVFLAENGGHGAALPLKTVIKEVPGVRNARIRTNKHTTSIDVALENPAACREMLTAVKAVAHPKLAYNAHVYVGPLRILPVQHICGVVEFLEPIAPAELDALLDAITNELRICHGEVVVMCKHPRFFALEFCVDKPASEPFSAIVEQAGIWHNFYSYERVTLNFHADKLIRQLTTKYL